MMTADLATSQWSAERGERWRAQLSPLEAMLTPVDEPLIHSLNLDAPYRIADVGCGGGGTTFEIRRLAPKGSTVHGYDVSPALVEEAKERSIGLDVQFELADVSSIAAPAARYGRLVSRFGTMFYDEPLQAFSNLRQWLLPGGRFAFAVWGPPTANPWAHSLREAIAAVVDAPPVDPDAPGPFRYAGAQKLIALLERAGFGEVESVDWQGKLAVGGGLPTVDAVDFALEAFSVANLLEGEEPTAFDAVRRSLIERFRGHELGGEVRLDAHVHFVTGRRP